MLVSNIDHTVKLIPVSHSKCIMTEMMLHKDEVPHVVLYKKQSPGSGKNKNVLLRHVQNLDKLTDTTC